MLSESAFISYYNSQILPELIEFEKYRKSQLFEYRVWQITRYLCLTILFIIAFLFFGYLSHSSSLGNIFIERVIKNDSRILLLMNVAIIFIAILAKSKMNELILKFSYASKYQLFEKIVSAYKNFHYYPLSGIDCKTINKSCLFGDFDDLESEDYIQGLYKNLEIKLSEIKLINRIKYEELRGNNYITVTENKTIFKGLFIITSINKPFSSITYILPNTWLKFLNSIPHYLNRVVLEDLNFEKEFDVYSSDQIESRYLLTPSFMERLLQINKIYKIRCCFVDKQMLIAIEFNTDFFPSLKLNKPLTYEKIKQIFDQLNIAFSIIDVLKLDMNIGL